MPTQQGIDRFIQRARQQGIPEEEIQRFVRQKQTQPQQEQKSLRGFGENLAQDVGRNIKGLATLPINLMKADVSERERLQSKGVSPYVSNVVSTPIAYGRAGKQMATGLLDDYRRLLTQPGEELYERPFTTALNVAPILGQLRGVGATDELASVSDDLASVSDDIARSSTDDLARATGVLDDVGRGDNLATRIGEKIKAGSDDLSSTLAKKGIGQPAQVERFEQAFGDLGRKLREYDVAPNDIGKLEDIIATRQSQFDDIALNSDITIPKSSIRATADQYIAELQAMNIDEADRIAKKIDGATDKYLSTLDEQATAEQITSQRRDYDKFVKKFKGDDVARSTNEYMRSILQDTLRSELDDVAVGGQNISELGAELNQLKTLEPIVRRASSRQGVGSLVKLTDITAGGAGGIAAGIPGVIGGLATKYLLGHPKSALLLSKIVKGGGGAVGGAISNISPQALTGATIGGRQLQTPMPQDTITGVTPQVSPQGLGGMTQDNMITNQMVQQGQLPASQAEIYPQGTAQQEPTYKGYTRNEFKRALLEQGADISEMEDADAIFDVLTGTSQQQGRELPASQAMDLSELQNSVQQLNILDPYIEQNKDIMGPIEGRARRLNPYDTQAQAFDAQMSAVAQQVGRAMEGGVLRKEDEIKYRRMLPNITDTPEVAKKKLQGVRQLLEAQVESAQTSLETAGFGGTGGVPTSPSGMLGM